MKKFTLIALISLGLFTLTSYVTQNKSKTYKCLIQLKNYEGEGAYIVASIIDSQGNYVKTLQVFGDDPEWYHDLTQWWNYYKDSKDDIEAITGATISGGERKIKMISIDDDFVDNGYFIRFESIVEQQNYYPDDIHFEITQELLNGKKIEGKGYIRYIRIINQK